MKKVNSIMKLSNNSSFVILIFGILKFRNIDCCTFCRFKFQPPPRSPDYIQDNDFFCNLLITCRHYYYAKYVFAFFNVVGFFQIFVTSQSTEILIILNF